MVARIKKEWGVIMKAVEYSARIPKLSSIG